MTTDLTRRSRNTLRVPSATHPAIATLWAEMNRRQLSVRAVSRKAGVTDKAMRNWRAGHSARLADLEACLNALGLEICTKPAEET